MTSKTLNGADEDAKEEIIVVETPPEKDADTGRTDSGSNDADDKDEEDDDEPESDDRRAKRTEGDHGDEERDAIRARRRQEKIDRKAKREEAIRRNNTEMDFLRKRNNDLERRLSGVELQTAQQGAVMVDDALAKAQREVKLAETVIAKAVAANNGEDVAQALRYRDEAVQRARQLESLKQQARAQPDQTQQQPQVPHEVLKRAQSFVNEHKWYDPSGANEDSAIMLAIDAQLVREGYNPNGDDYWAELRKRGKRRLPERFAAASTSDEDDDAPAPRKPRGGPPMASGRDHAPQSTRREVYINPERKQALIDAGVWDDPVLREKYVRRYAQYDREAAANKR